MSENKRGNICENKLENVCENKRESYLDIAKGIGIILVIWAHTVQTDGPTGMEPLNLWLYSFHVPLFFIISGICFKPGVDFLTFLKKKARRCLIPYFVFGMLIVLVEMKTGYLYETGFMPNFIRFLKQERYSTVWFLATLLLASILFYFIDLICRHDPLIVLIVSIVLSVVFVYLDQNHIRALYWNLDTAFIVLGFMAFGYFIKNFKGILGKLLALKGKKRGLVITAFFFGNLIFFIGNLLISGTNLEMYWNSYGVYPLMFLAAAFGTLFVIMISSMISSMISFKPLETLGRNSLTYFAIHQSVVMWPLLLLARKIGMLTFRFSFKNVISKIIVFALTIVICALVDRLIRKTKLKVILGE